MKVTTKDGTRRYWGVSHQKERSVIRAKFTDADGNFDNAGFTQACMDRAGMFADLDPFTDPAYKSTPAHYVVTIRINGKLWKVATSYVLNIAARRYDEALFHLWGFRKSPKARFNFYKKGDAIPDCPPRVTEIRRALLKLFGAGFDYNFLNQQNPPIK